MLPSDNFTEKRNTLVCGDALAVLQTLPDGFVQTCITSPPYFGLRDYQTATWEGGNAECDHLRLSTGMSDKNTLGHSGHLPETNAANIGRKQQYTSTCGKCGATRIDQQIGLEETPDAYVSKLVEVFREVRRVLHPSGTAWINLGDSYAGSSKGWGNTQHGKLGKHAIEFLPGPTPDITGLKPKDLIGVPWMVALALRADGWYLRQEIIWHKPNCMPESVEDRPTTAHEHLFLLAKNERYYYDADAIREPGQEWTGQAGTFARSNGKATHLTIPGQRCVSHREERTDRVPTGRNKRSVWTVSTRSYADAHFATFPPKLIEPCILAGSRTSDIVLDPFMGAGTTALVALQYGRDYLGIDLNAKYLDMARKRIETFQPDMWAWNTTEEKGA